MAEVTPSAEASAERCTEELKTLAKFLSLQATDINEMAHMISKSAAIFDAPSRAQIMNVIINSAPILLTENEKLRNVVLSMSTAILVQSQKK